MGQLSIHKSANYLCNLLIVKFRWWYNKNENVKQENY